MREISLVPKDNSDKLERALVNAIREIKPPVINNQQPTIEVKTDSKRCSYRIEVERDGHGRIKAMVANPI